MISAYCKAEIYVFLNSFNMNKYLKLFFLLILIFIGFSFTGTSVLSMDNQHLGKIYLQVESHGEAWYVNPVDGKRIYLMDGATAYSLMRDLGLGITDDDLNKIPIGLEDRFVELDSDSDGLSDRLEEALKSDPNNADTDGDGFLDGIEVKNGYNPLGSGRQLINNSLSNKLSGKILLQVESKGEAWYINPADGKRYYMSGGDSAYQIMRYLGVGITNNDLAKIQIVEVIGENNQIVGVIENVLTQDELAIVNLFDSYMAANKEGDLDAMLGLTYYGQVGDLYLNMIYDNDQEKVLELKVTLRNMKKDIVSGIEYEIDEIEIEDNTAIIAVNSTKNQHIKEVRYFYFINDEDTWKMNQFGLYHPPDIVVENFSECNAYCEQNNYNPGENFTNEESGECYCMHEVPELEDLSYLEVEECEVKGSLSQWSCYLSYAESAKNEDYCKKINSVTVSKSCYEEVALEKNDMSICRFLWDDSVCLSQFE